MPTLKVWVVKSSMVAYGLFLKSVFFPMHDGTGVLAAVSNIKIFCRDRFARGLS